MLKFTDPRKYVMGIGTAYATSLSDGSVVYWSDKFQDANTNVSASEVVLNAGIGNGPAIILYNDPNITVTLTAADYDEYIHAAAAGATFEYGAPVEVCQTVTATSTSLTIDIDDGTPVAGPGMSDVLCYVQAVGAASYRADGGVAYELDAESGEISGFAATSGTTYLVTYYVAQANASLTTYTSSFNGDVVRWVYRQPIYTNYDASTDSGDLYGWKITIIPYLKLNPSTASASGSQSGFTTTAITGRALTYDDEVISSGCDDCSMAGAPLAYTVIAPCDTTEDIDGIIGIVGGTVSLTVGDSYQLTPGVIVNNVISYGVPATDFTYTSGATGYATVGSSTGIIAAIAAGTATITIAYTVDGTTYYDYIEAVVSAS